MYLSNIWLVFFIVFSVVILAVTIFQIRSNLGAAPGDGHMLLFYDGATIPAGWTCVSCNPADPFYERFVRGSDQYGGSGGSATHQPTFSASISSSNEPAVSENWNTGSVAAAGHSHSLTVNVSEETNLPEYRQLRVIRHNDNGEPAIIPEGAIAIFESSALPSGWEQYSDQGSRYVYASDTVGATGGSNVSQHAITGTIGGPNGATLGSRGGGTQVTAAAADHIHTFSGQTQTIDIQPPHVEAILAQAVTDTVVPSDMLAMWDDEAPVDWQLRSNETGPYYERFIKPSSSFGANGGSATHQHSNVSIITSTPTTTTGARAGSAGASGIHTHTIDVTNFSEQNHVPPYIDVIIAKKQEPSDLSQASYRWFRNRNSTDVGLALASQDTPATSIGLPFRLRLAIVVTVVNLGQSGESLKLQYAQRVGETCDPTFSNESYVDVLTNSGEIRYYNNSAPVNGDPLTPNLNDPTLASGSKINQSYVEANNYSNNQAAIDIGDYGLWDFALSDANAPADTSYCFRAVYADGSLFESYNEIPEITTSDSAGNMVVLFAGATVPAGWTCISCNPGEPFYERFARGSASYGTTGGSEAHSHTATGTVLPTIAEVGSDPGVGDLSSTDHGHGIVPILDEASNLPPYRQLRFIRSEASGTPSSLPAGAIAIFDNEVPDDWTRYSVQDNQYVRGQNNVGATGGSLTHSHSVIGTTTTATGSTVADGGGGPASAGAGNDHQHTLSGTSPAENHEPPYIEVLLGELDIASGPPAGIITMWDGPPPGSWDVVSESGEPFHERFIKASDTYGLTGGSTSHSHANHQVTTSGPTTTTGTRQNNGGAASATHTHPVDITNVSEELHLPPYRNVIFAKQPVPNTPPSQPTGLGQFRVALGSEISPGGFTNETQVHFRAEASDPDDEDELELCVEVQTNGEPFTNQELSCGDAGSYAGLPITVDVVISGLANTAEYRWQARIRDSAGEYSEWVVFGSGDPSDNDFIVDTVEPSGTVYDGDQIGIDITYSDDALDSLSANWDIDSGLSGLASYDYSIGLSPGGTTIADWVTVGTDTSVTASGLNLQTSEVYYFNIRTTDNAGNQSVISSSGQLVAPSISFSVSQSEVSFDSLSPSNDFTDTQDITVTTSTNARSGYVVRARTTSLLTSPVDAIPMFNGGSYLEPAAWIAAYVGFGYTSNDTNVQGENRFSGDPCPGGGEPPCFAPFTLDFPGDIVADNQGPIIGTPVVGESFIITGRVTAPEGQSAGDYQTTIIFSATALY